MPRLTLFLGGGGVGKTTLSAALGLARARSGERVGLLSIDPARRLRSALHLEAMGEEGAAIPSGAGELRAALLEPEVCLRRWAAEACPDEASRARLFADPFFCALADRLACATDAIAAARAAEWAESDPDLDELIIDTAPGVPGIELIARPQRLLAMLQGRVIGWLRQAGRGGRLLGGLSRISGVETLERLGDFFTLLDEPLQQLARRIERARDWLPQASVLVVAGVSHGSARAAVEIAQAVRALRLRPELAILNRALPATLHGSDDPAARQFLLYVERYRGLQNLAAAELARAFPRVVSLPESERTDLDGLAELGAALSAQLR